MFKSSGNQTAGSGSSKEAVADDDFPSLQEAAMLARGVKIDDQRKRNIVTKDNGNENWSTDVYRASDRENLKL